MQKKSVALFTLILVAALSIPFLAISQNNPGSNHGNKFEQLGQKLRDPNSYRSADGSPGPQYWQQRADYDIECTLDEENLRLDGKETITYHNQSPSTLRYLWLQLDENEHDPHNPDNVDDGSTIRPQMSERAIESLDIRDALEGYGHKIHAVTDANGTPLKYTINYTMMRVELPTPLKSGEQFVFNVDWHYNITDRVDGLAGGRGGYEYFEDDGNYLHTIVQWFPRMAVYSDFEGWQNKQFTGRGEFALNFGNYKVKMTVPADHMVGATGECQNYEEVLTAIQMQRWKQAQNATAPIEIVTLAEAKANEQKKKSTATKTWIFEAENVRDFAWTSSRKFVWDAMPHITEENKKVMCMSYYAKEAYPIYNKYSTKAVEHTLDVYSKHTIPYPYPVAISVEAANGMEYPMICFNPGRAEADGTYTERSKIAALTVIIHEVGHNYFPMIVNSDERQWTWMDEGINSFLQFLAEQEFDVNYKHWGGTTDLITSYMKQPKNRLEPIMTNSENIVNFGSNAYDKPATALNVLRETIMGRELFDYAFKEYARRWAFKHPTPADFFRTMEDASGVDLDWFWQGWFYGTDAVDISLDSINWYKVDLKNNPEKRESNYPWKQKEPRVHIAQKKNKESGMKSAVDKDPELRDIYTTYEPWNTADSVINYTTYLYDETYSKKEKKKLFGDKNYYELYFSNKGGLVMPVIIEWEFKDGTKEVERIPVEIWRKNEEKFTKVFVKNKEVKGIVIDPYHETADIDESNNNWPVKELPSRFQVFKKHKQKELLNPMQKAKKKTKIP